MPADATAPGWASIDVYADVVPGIGQRGHGQRRMPAPAPTGALEHGYQPPALDIAPIGRPTVWAATAADRDTVLARFDTLVGTRDEVGFGALDGQRRRGLIVMLHWLAPTASQKHTNEAGQARSTDSRSRSPPPIASSPTWRAAREPPVGTTNRSADRVQLATRRRRSTRYMSPSQPGGVNVPL